MVRKDEITSGIYNVFFLPVNAKILNLVTHTYVSEVKVRSSIYANIYVSEIHRGSMCIYVPLCVVCVCVCKICVSVRVVSIKFMNLKTPSRVSNPD